MQDATGAYHIDVEGNPAYSTRFDRTFGFYCGAAAVIKDGEWFHITPDGSPLYSERYTFCGNFQENLCTVRDQKAFHIDLQGKPIYPERWTYVGDYKYGIAAVTNDAGLQTHIDTAGNLLHGQWYPMVDVYHKGYARARDLTGWCHIDAKGTPVYPERYKTLEPFYNGIAFAETFDGAYTQIDESGRVINTLKAGDPMGELSGQMVGYWTSFTLYHGVDVLDSLPKPISPSDKLLRALWELQVVVPKEGMWHLTTKGELLNTPSCRAAAKMWIDSHLSYWQKFSHSPDYFQDLQEVETYHLALQAYTPPLAHLPIWEKHKKLIDIGGGTGALLSSIKKAYPHLSILLFDRPEVVALSEIPSLGGSFFDPIPEKADAILLSRVLHDWDDKKALQILRNAADALTPDGTLYILEMERDDQRPDGSLLDLHMQVVTGGKERTCAEWNQLLAQSNLVMRKRILISPILTLIAAYLKTSRN